MLFHLQYLVGVEMFTSFGGVKILRKILPSKSKCMFIATALVKPLLKIGLM
jgi:hypothetical protein